MRNNKGQYTRNKFLNWRIWVVSVTLISCVVMSNYGNKDKAYVAENKVEAFMIPIIVEPEETLEEKFQRYFPRSWKTMLAIAQAESRLDPEAKNWNCYYNRDSSVVYTERVKGSHSAACKKEHRKYAWSVDCNILQANYKGKECPSITIDEHLEEMAELTKKRSFQPWVTYNRGLHLSYMK